MTATSADKNGVTYVFKNNPNLSRLNGPGLNDKLQVGDVGELDDASGNKIGVTAEATRGTRFTVPAGTPSIRLDDTSSMGFTVEPLPATVTGATGVVAYLDPYEHSFYGLLVTGDDDTVFPDDPATYTPATTGND